MTTPAHDADVLARAVRDGTLLVGQQGAGGVKGGVVVVGQPVVNGCPGHRPCNGVVLRRAIGGEAIARGQIVDRERVPHGVEARRRLEDAVRLAVRAEKPRHGSHLHHDVHRSLDGMTWGACSRDWCWCMTGKYSYVSSRGVPQRVAIVGGKGTCAEANPLPERTSKKIAPCPARRVLTSSPRERRAAFHAKSAGAVGGPTDIRTRKKPTPRKFTSAKKWPNGTAGRWRERVCQT